MTQNVLDILTGKTVKHTWENKEKLLGLSADDVAKKIVEIYNLPITWEEYKAMAREEMRIVMRECEVCEGKIAFWDFLEILILKKLLRGRSFANYVTF